MERCRDNTESTPPSPQSYPFRELCVSCHLLAGKPFFFILVILTKHRAAVDAEGLVVRLAPRKRSVPEQPGSRPKRPTAACPPEL